MKDLCHLMKSKTELVLLTISISILAVTVSFAWNRRLADLIDFVCEGHQATITMVWKMCLLILLVALTEAAFTFVSGLTGEKISEELRDAFACEIQSKKSSELTGMSVGGQLSKLLNEVEEIADAITENMFPLIADFIKCVITFIWLTTLNATVILITMLPVFIVLIYSFLASRILGTLALQSQRARQKTNGIADTILELFPVMKLYAAEGVMLNSYTQMTNKWAEVASKEERRRSLLMSLSAILSCLPTLMLMLVGGIQIINGEMKLGTLYLFINMSANVTGFFMNMPGNIGTFRRFLSNIKSMKAI